MEFIPATDMATKPYPLLERKLQDINAIISLATFVSNATDANIAAASTPTVAGLSRVIVIVTKHSFFDSTMESFPYLLFILDAATTLWVYMLLM